MNEMFLTDEEIRMYEEKNQMDQDEYNLTESLKRSIDEFTLTKEDYGYAFRYKGEVTRKLINCDRVSKAFIKHCFESERDYCIEEPWEEINWCEGFKEIDMDELVDEAIHEDWWNWREEVKEYKGNE